MSNDEYQKRINQLAIAAIAYAGPLDDPRVGWVGRSPSSSNLFRCERCEQEHEDCTLIPHKDGCTALVLINAMKAVAKGEENVPA